jgi:hypothetical protein
MLTTCNKYSASNLHARFFYSISTPLGLTRVHLQGMFSVDFVLIALAAILDAATRWKTKINTEHSLKMASC